MQIQTEGNAVVNDISIITWRFKLSQRFCFVLGFVPLDFYARDFTHAERLAPLLIWRFRKQVLYMK